MTKKSQTTHRTALRVSRSATARRGEDGIETKALSDWRTLDAYVLLGDPGAGKSWCFEDESAACHVTTISARDIVDRVARAPGQDQIVFIDGLDEVRAGAGDGKAPLGAIREWLAQAGNPRFRLSCREADWLGESDLRALERVAPGQRVEVLHLEPLSRAEVMTLLHARPNEVSDADAFWHQAEQHGLIPLFGNPLLLDLTIKAVASGGGAWPSTRQGIYEAACRQLAIDRNIEHRAAKPLKSGEVDRLLNDAGLLCAVLLLSNKLSCSQGMDDSADSLAWAALPEPLPLHDARAALASKVFTTVAGRSTPRHRSIAEYLAAKALAKLIHQGLPLARVLALMQGFDGKPVEPMRGLLAWLVVHHRADRARLLQLDPLGIVLNGDVAALGRSERIDLLKALGTAAKQNQWFRKDAWVSHPFGPLATADMAETYEAVLTDTARDETHQAFIDCVFDALHHGEHMPSLQAPLEAWVADPLATMGNRIAAYRAWQRHAPESIQASKQLTWLGDLHAGRVVDDEDRLTSVLLCDLYPRVVGPQEIWTYLRSRRRQGAVPDLSNFWSYNLLRQSRPGDFAALADAWLAADLSPNDDPYQFGLRRLKAELLLATLKASGDTASVQRLYAWLGICLDPHGSSELTDDAKRDVALWLEDRPELIKAVVAMGLRLTKPNRQGRRYFWEAQQRVHGARLPSDWLRWLLVQASSTQDSEVAEYCFEQVAASVMDPPEGFDVPTMDGMVHWVNSHSTPELPFHEWLEKSWTCSLEDWRGDQHRRQLAHKVQQAQARDQRRQAMRKHWPSFSLGTASDGMLHQVALAYKKRFSDVVGDTPLERVQDLLVCDSATAASALASIDQVLGRQDLPTVDDILALEAKGKYHFIRPPALLAAQLAWERDAAAPLAWPESLAQKMVAFYLADGLGNMPAWYEMLVEAKPELVAPILLRYAAPKLKHKAATGITGLWALSRRAKHQELARLVLPGLLAHFPLRAGEAARRELNHSLLAALHLLPEAEAAQLVSLKLSQPGMDATQRIAWMVADLPYHAASAERLADWVGKNERRAIALGVAMEEQGSLARTVQRLQPAAVRRLAEILAAITSRETETRGGWVTAVNHRQDTVRGLLNVLAANPSVEARDELLALSQSQRLGSWDKLVRYSMQAQQSIAREAQFQAAAPAAVALALTNASPANAPDLQALLLDHLDGIEASLRGDNTFLVKQFWRDTQDGPLPQTENDCRDLLLDKLSARLAPLNVLVEREKSEARDKRADMSAEIMQAGKQIALPIEVKKDNHDKLWTAWNEQLIQLYAIDPAASGYGLYLVLWFNVRPQAFVSGAKSKGFAHLKPRASPEGIKPTSAQVLQRMIEERIPTQDRSRLAVKVMDMSLPSQP
ncbi:MAG: hypothetical protein KA375_09495 [Vitreoscilla sp.]|nr:hypothetical protein [Vitreoscilla sp.]MBP6674404.1 hypothetical protein [Vitreoscilla sp.]